MLNEEKVIYMTKAASYESGPEKKNIKIDSYFRGDYLGLQMVKSGIAYTIAFCILIAIWIMSRMEVLLLEISRASYLENIVKILVIVYVAGLVLYEIAAYIYYSRKHDRAKQSVKEFHAYLKRIHKFYEAEESAEEKTAGERNTL